MLVEVDEFYFGQIIDVKSTSNADLFVHVDGLWGGGA